MLPFFPLDVLDEIWDLIESVSEGFPTYSSHPLSSPGAFDSEEPKTLTDIPAQDTDTSSSEIKLSLKESLEMILILIL